MAGRIQVEKLSITQYPDPVLRQVCQPVETFDDELRRVAARMFELMRADKGLGLAAPQARLLIRMFVCNPTGEPGDDLIAVNPELDDLTDTCDLEEGCLCLPEVSVVVRRAKSAILRAYDLSGQPFERKGVDLEARIWQHEIDHLNGRLIIDYMSEAAEIANRRALKHLRETFKQSA
jgi:peptide deformylase